MIRIILFAALALIAFLIIGNILANRNQNGSKILSYLLAILVVVAIAGFTIWLLPRLGINLSGFLKSFLPLINNIRGFLPF